MVIQKAYYQSPLGWLEIRATRKGVVSIEYVPEKGDPGNRSPLLTKVKDQLKEYFDKKRTAFTVPLELEGTDFQVIVWKELKKIPFGTTTTYHDLAKHLGDPNSDRAVGHAVGKNPINIIIPCHRVISQDGKLTGYTTAEGLPQNNVVSVWADADDSLWIGTFGRGLAHFAGGRFTELTTQDGLTNDLVSPTSENYAFYDTRVEVERAAG